MSHPREGEHVRVQRGDHELRNGADKHAGIRVGPTWISPSLDQRPLEEIQKTVEFGGGPRIPESTFRPMVCGKFHRSLAS